MRVSRREFIKTGVATTAAIALPQWAIAQTEVGEMVVQTVSDGSLSLPFDFIFEPVPDEIRNDTVSTFDLDGETLTPPCNLTLIRHGENLILFDAGSGPAFQPSAGEIVEALEATSVAPEDITHVVFTHAHPDHIWGVLDDFDDPVFFNAQHMIGRREFDYWTKPDTVNSIGTARQTFAVGAARRLEALADSLTFFEDGEEILPGIAAVLTPGHTPGHMSFEARSGSDALMILGDAVGNHHIAMRHPSVPLGSDQNLEEAATTRISLLNRIFADNMRIAGFHLPQGGLGRVDRFGDGFAFLAET